MTRRVLPGERQFHGAPHERLPHTGKQRRDTDGRHHRGAPVHQCKGEGGNKQRQEGGEQQQDGEQSEPAHVRAWGPKALLPGLDQRPCPGEEMDGETTRFGALALRLWNPVLTAEQGSW